MSHYTIMYSRFIIVLLLPISGIFARACDRELIRYDIVPEVVNSCKGKLRVNFDKTQVNCGSNVSVMDTMHPPEVFFDALFQCGKYATVIMVDLDADVIGPYLHWVVQNIPVKTLLRGYHGDDEGYREFPWQPIVPLSSTGINKNIYEN
ncbi:uncharacterized protein [Parasteatoda tepidariorum]|uniref:uncharacterized protein n=1 Tax=Parasteatoda tepidariorum TaxID=114398 RepID=UPI0039BD2126